MKAPSTLLQSAREAPHRDAQHADLLDHRGDEERRQHRRHDCSHSREESLLTEVKTRP